MKNRPWTIWWNFRWNKDHSDLEWVDVLTDHPDYTNIDYIYRFKIEDCLEGEYIDKWETEWFYPFRDDYISGRESIHTLMKELGHKKDAR